MEGLLLLVRSAVSGAHRATVLEVSRTHSSHFLFGFLSCFWRDDVVSWRSYTTTPGHAMQQSSSRKRTQSGTSSMDGWLLCVRVGTLCTVNCVPPNRARVSRTLFTHYWYCGMVCMQFAIVPPRALAGNMGRSPNRALARVLSCQLY